MNPIHYFVNEHVINALGWTLIHSLWQIALIGLLLKISLVFLKKKSAETRYLFSVVSLFSIVVISLFTFIKISQNSLDNKQIFSYETVSNSLTEVQYTVLASSESHGVDTFILSIDKIGRLINSNLNFIVVVWFLGATFFSLRFAGNFWYINRLKKQQVLPVSGKLIQMASAISNKLNLQKHIQVLESAIIKTPMVIGYLKPVILLPVGLATSLPIDQVEAILAHEMAHISRNDYLINLLKSLIEVVIFYHPIIWWISSTLETEREHCCDDITIRICGNEKSLQKALLNLQQFGQYQTALATALLNNKYKLLNRIMRMKTTNQFKHGINGSLAGFVIILGGMIVLATSSAFSPRLSDLPGEYKTEKLGLLPDNLLTDSQAVVESTDDQQNTSKPDDFKEVISGSIPDTTIKSSGTSAAKVSDKVTMEFDGNYNLVSVKKDGKPLEGDEKKEYEAMAAKMKVLNEQEKKQEEQKAALEIAEKELQAAQEKIEKAQNEYEKAMAAYHGSYFYSDDSLNTNVFVWTEGGSDNPKTVREIKIEKYPDHPDISEIYALKLSEEELSEALEEGMAEVNYDIQMDQLENEMRIIEIEKEFNDQKGAKTVIVKTSGSEDLISTIREELSKDGILKDADDKLNFSLSQDELEVNGEKLSADLHKKYLKLYKQTTGNKLSGEFKIIIKD